MVNQMARRGYRIEHQDGRYWHLADIQTVPVFVRFWTKADKVGFRPGGGLSANDPKRTCDATIVTELLIDINSPDADRASAQLKNALARDLAEVPFQPR